MDNWNFTGRPDIPAWPQDAQGQEEKAVLLMQTFDSPADTDMVISLLEAQELLQAQPVEDEETEQHA